MGWVASKDDRPIICPECAAGKHMYCDGIADIDENDNWIDCECIETDEKIHPMR